MPASSPGQQIQDRHREAVPLRPADVHPHEHLGPVLRLGAAGPRMDGEQRVPGVVRALEHRLQLERRDARRSSSSASCCSSVAMPASGSASSSCAISTAPASRCASVLVRRDPSFERLDFLHRGARRLGVGPEGGLRLASLEVLQPLRLGGKVKESLAARRPGPAARSDDRPVRPCAPAPRVGCRMIVGRTPGRAGALGVSVRRPGRAFVGQKSWRPPARISFSASRKYPVDSARSRPTCSVYSS